jgi:MFS family permease
MTDGRARTARELPRALRPFRSPQYRLLATALALSLLGAGIWVVALVWQVIELGGGPADLSAVATASAVGMLLTVLVAGALADRVPQKRLLVVVEITKTLAIGTAGVLAVTGNLELWHLVVASLFFGIGEGIVYPAYSAWLPAIISADDLLAANGVEGVLRPSIMQAAGPVIAGGIIAAWAPGPAFLVIAAAQACAAVVLAVMHETPVRREAIAPGNPVTSMLRDIGEGVRYMVRTRWLLVTLLYFSLLVLAVMGPIEVLLPFAVRDQTGGGAGSFALVLAAFGVGGAVGSMVVASLRLARRYLTVMNVCWGVGSLPLAAIGFVDQLWLLAILTFVVGFTFQAGAVIWGTLLQRRVPPALLGRVSSLDFFVSLALMPISMALAGPVGEQIGIPFAFVIAGLVPTVLAVVVVFGFGLLRDEIEHPLDRTPDTLEDAASAPA